MADLNYYQVVFDADGEVIETKNLGEANAKDRIVGVLATSAAQARSKARTLLGQNQK